jgi:hypothetical protein
VKEMVRLQLLLVAEDFLPTDEPKAPLATVSAGTRLWQYTFLIADALANI